MTTHIMGHTPGPWRVNQMNHADAALWLTIGFQHEGRWIGPLAELKYLTTDEGEQWANARLIAAAPEMLEALKAVALHGYFGVQAQVDAAIAKAEGQQAEPRT